MADDRTNNIETRTLFDDVLKTSKSASQFGPVRVYRVPEQPADDFGRNGDLCIIDNTAVSSIEIAIEQCPTDVGFCQKIFAMVPDGPNRAVSTVNGADLTGNDSFTINGDAIVLPAGSVFVKDAADAINAAALSGISSIGNSTSAPGTVTGPYALPGYQIIINGTTVTFAINGGTGYIASQIEAAAIPFILVSTLGDKISLTHTRGGTIVLGGTNLIDIMGTPTVSGGTLSITNESGLTVTLADVVGNPLATMGFPITIAPSPLVCGGTWQCFDANGIEIKDHGTPLGSFDTFDFIGAGVVVTDGGGGELIVDISGGISTIDVFKNVIGNTGGTATASGSNDTLTIVGTGNVTTNIVGNTLTISSSGGGGTQNLFDTFTGNTGTVSATTPTDALAIVGTGIINTALVGNTLTISSTGAGTQSVWLTVQDDVAATISATGPTDTLTVAGGTGISTAVAGTTLTVTNTAPAPTGMTITTINGQPMLTLVDTTRANKILSVAEQPITFAENKVDNLDWIQIGNANDADSAYIADFDGTVVFATAHCENTQANSKDIHLFINGDDKGSLGTLSGGANATFVNTTIDINVTRGARIRLRAVGATGSIEDTVVKLTLKWRG